MLGLALERVMRRPGRRAERWQPGVVAALTEAQIIAAINATTPTAFYLGGAGLTLSDPGGKVQAWTDQSGNGRTLTQSTDADRPTTSDLHGRTCPLFDDTDFLAGTATLGDLINADAYHVISLPKPTSITLNAGNIYNNHVQGANSGLDWGGAFKNVSGTTPGFGAWHYDGAFKATTFSNVTVDALTFTERKFDGVTISARAGTDTFKTVAAGNVSSGLATACRIGRVTSGQGYVGALAAHLVWDRVLSASDAAEIKRLLKLLYPSAVG
jgi:hypothetical protein